MRGLLRFSFSVFCYAFRGFFWGIPWDALGGWYHPDENYIFYTAIWSPGVIASTDALVYPTFFQHLLVLLALPLRLVLDSPSDEFSIAVVLAGRFCSVLAGTGAIYVTYRLARDVSNERNALLAAALLFPCITRRTRRLARPTFSRRSSLPSSCCF